MGKKIVTVDLWRNREVEDPSVNNDVLHAAMERVFNAIQDLKDKGFVKEENVHCFHYYDDGGEKVGLRLCNIWPSESGNTNFAFTVNLKQLSYIKGCEAMETTIDSEKWWLEIAPQMAASFENRYPGYEDYQIWMERKGSRERACIRGKRDGSIRTLETGMPGARYNTRIDLYNKCFLGTQNVKGRNTSSESESSDEGDTGSERSGNNGQNRNRIVGELRGKQFAERLEKNPFWS